MFHKLCKSSMTRALPRILPQNMSKLAGLSTLTRQARAFKPHKFTTISTTNFQKNAAKANLSTLTSLNQSNKFLKTPPKRVFPQEDMSVVLKAAIAEGLFDAEDPWAVPVGFFYDLDLLDWQLKDIKEAFGPTFHHHFAIKSNSVTSMLQMMYFNHGIGLECCSLGEVMHSLRCQVPHTHIVYDSPCKTSSELEYILKKKIYCNLDNYEDVDRAAKIIAKNGIKTSDLGPTGIRINPLVGAGEIKALSVSTEDSKFGVPISEMDRLLKLYKKHDWMNSVHVHVGSGGMGVEVLKEGVKVAVKFALQVNELTNGQIKYIDIGGGKPANYVSDALESEKVPAFREYADILRAEVPELFSGDFKVITEFGQGISAKLAFLASPIEWMKGTEEKPLPIVHFGADTCVRQIYDNKSHERRIEVYKPDGSAFPEDDCKKNGFVYGEYNGSLKNLGPEDGLPYNYSIGGPLCFQGDFLARDVRLPAGVTAGDMIVMKDVGATTLAAFSRHTSRLVPPVYGFRWQEEADGSRGVKFQTLKPRETIEELSNFWGPLHPITQ